MALNEGSAPEVDLIIPVHTPTRPIERAVRSALRSDASVRITVVAHNTDPEPIAARLGALSSDRRVRILEFADGIRSATGPFNFGLDQATGRFTSVMGSDDELEPGAIASWLRLADRRNAAAVIPRQRHASGGGVMTPVARPLRTTGLDPVRDRLDYRSAPLGLVSRERFGELRFAEGLRTGEDVSYVLRLWASGEEIAFDRRGPAYLVHDDAGDRITFTEAPVRDDLEHIERILDDPWFRGLPEPVRRAFATKALRVSVFGAVHGRQNRDHWAPEDLASLRRIAERLIAAADRPEGPLSRADRNLLDAILGPDADAARLRALGEARRRFASIDALIPRRIGRILDREAPLRFITASLFLR
ncbi:glycosyltransferase [Leucobacter sp. CSA2]|uniref:Glycosyltransferase n=1 Tax=Leucobacter edaphi TaxID=2796472 RepID=A0A934QBZ1_9MICO|nr:glycosyltransferase [Leucobacter edaphi]